MEQIIGLAGVGTVGLFGVLASALKLPKTAKVSGMMRGDAGRSDQRFCWLFGHLGLTPDLTLDFLLGCRRACFHALVVRACATWYLL